MDKKKTIFVGMSGGVDCSDAALRLKEAGHTVVGVFIKVWHPDFLTCSWEEERLDAMRVAAHLEIPFLTCDAEKTYKDSVAEYFIRGYEKGETPNPDVMCNKYVKFGAFYTFAKEHGADAIATGHYARIDNIGEYSLFRGIDNEKDQSYFLWGISKDMLSDIYFPIGMSQKNEVRLEAKKYDLPTAEKKESQGICFLGHVDIKKFLSHYMELKKGNVLNDAGRIIGEHQGAAIYTLGQRHGFDIFNHSPEQNPYFVIGKDLKTNTITVRDQKSEGTNITLMLTGINWLIKDPNVYTETELLVQNRYRQEPMRAQLLEAGGEHAMLRFVGDIEIPAPGQSCVIYEKDHCLGGGIIKEIT